MTQELPPQLCNFWDVLYDKCPYSQGRSAFLKNNELQGKLFVLVFAPRHSGTDHIQEIETKPQSDLHPKRTARAIFETMCTSYCTVKSLGLQAKPPAVETETTPVFAPDGTMAVTSVSEFTVNDVAFTPSNVTTLV